MKSSQSGEKKRAIVLRALDQHEQRLARYVARLLGGDSERARDIVQHAFLKLCQQDVFEIEKRIGPWLYSVCRNKVFDESKRSAADSLNSVDIQFLDEGADPATIASQHEFIKLIRRLILDLPSAQREAIDLWADGFSSREIGEVMNKKEPAVRALVHRAMQSIKSHPSVIKWTDIPESPKEKVMSRELP